MSTVRKFAREWTPGMFKSDDDPAGIDTWRIMLECLFMPPTTAAIRVFVTLTPYQPEPTLPGIDEKPKEPLEPQKDA